MKADYAVEVKDLVKVFPARREPVRAVDGISFVVEHGEIFGFLGPNGAGKTTTLEIVEGLQNATSGSAKILGLAVASQLDEIKPRIGVQLQEQSYFTNLRLGEILRLYGSFYESPTEAMSLLGTVGLEEKVDAKVKQLSGGQARRFAIATSLVNNPEVLFLDEPTSGLDPQARRHLWDLVTTVRDRGTTIILTTHYMDEAEILCDRVAIMDHGRIQQSDTPLALIRNLDSAYHIRFVSHDPVTEDSLLSIPGAVRAKSDTSGGSVRWDLEVGDPAMALPDFTRLVEGLRLDDLRIEPSTLEDVFLHLTGRELRD